MTAEEPHATAAAPDAAAFFAHYGRAFEAYDADEIAACYLTPCLLVHDGQTEALATADDLEASVRALLDVHRAWDVQKARPADVAVLEVGPAHAVVRVSWRLGRRRSRVAWTFATTYTLVPVAGGAGDWRIAVAVTHDAPF